jgi:hypothetical protein
MTGEQAYEDYLMLSGWSCIVCSPEDKVMFGLEMNTELGFLEVQLYKVLSPQRFGDDDGRRGNHSLAELFQEYDAFSGNLTM